MLADVQPLEGEGSNDAGPIANGGEIEVFAVVVEGMPDVGERGGDEVEDGDAAAQERDMVVLDAGAAELRGLLLGVAQEAAGPGSGGGIRL